MRPTLARAKTSLFDILASRRLLTGARVLDLFAGSGALGIEALSRGAESVIFVEQDRATARVLQANVTGSGFGERSVVLVQSCADALPRLARRGEVFDGIFIDPPYGTDWADRMLRLIDARALLRQDGWVVVHHRRGERHDPTCGTLIEAVRRRIGDAVMVIYRRVNDGGSGNA